MATVKIQASKTFNNYLNKALNEFTTNYSINNFIYRRTEPGIFTDYYNIIGDYVPVITCIYKPEMYAVAVNLYNTDLVQYFNEYKKITNNPELNGLLIYIIECLQI